MGNISENNLINELLSKHIDSIYPSREDLEGVLNSGKKLTIYWGIDPTSPDIHLGHSTNFFVLRRFQKLGHKIIILIGDYTAQIGDPSGKDKKRKALTEGEVKNNFKTYKNQILKILDSKKTIFRFNSEWWNKMSAKKLLELDDFFTYQQIIERNMFQRRIKEGRPISLKELQYPMLQGYDSVALETDIELGATDQLFNMMTGRELVRNFLRKEKFIITTPLLVNPKTGNKLMSKSEGGYISLNDSFSQIYGKIMALPDSVMLTCFELCTDFGEADLKNIKTRMDSKENPRDIKLKLAYEVVKIYYGDEKAKKAASEFRRVFQEHRLPENIATVTLGENKYNIVDLLVDTGLTLSKNQSRRLIIEGAVKINNKTLSDLKSDINITSGMIIQAGKKHFRRLELKL